MVEILHTIAQAANLTIQPFTALDFGYQLSELDDVGTVIYELMENRTIDLIASPLQWTEKRAARFDFSEEIYEAQMRVILSKRKEAYGQMLSFFETYDQFTWLSFLLAWTLQFVFCVCAQRCEAHLTRRKASSVAELAWRLLRLMLLQPEVVKLETKAGKFSLFVFSLVHGSVLLGVFSSFVLANIIHSSRVQRDGTMREFLADFRQRDLFVAATNPQKWIFELMNTSADFPWAELRQAGALSGMHVRPRIEDVVQLMADGRGVSFSQEDDRSFVEAMKNCRLTSFFDAMPRVKAFLMFRRGHPLLPAVNAAIRRKRHVFQRIVAKYGEAARSRVHCAAEVGYRALKLPPFLGVLFVSAIVMGVAAVVLLVEVVVKRRVRKWPRIKYP
ncbi:hypothetical protein M3Y99_00666700 [Aphelenchoides fujianensis]|nr:hypothetical protein M3Y99_00666700 [Aphelenchoides fujianensis]